MDWSPESSHADQDESPATASAIRPGLRDLGFFTFEASSLNNAKLLLGERLALARHVIRSGVWLELGSGATMNLVESALFAEAPRQNATPIAPANFMFSIPWNQPGQFVHQRISSMLKQLRLSQMRICELCLSDGVADQFANGGDTAETLRRLKLRGIVQRFTLSVGPECDAHVLGALQNGVCDGLIDGFIVGLSPIQRNVSNALWNELIARRVPIIARFPTGGLTSIDSPEFMRSIAQQSEATQQKYSRLTWIFRNSGCADWTQFCLRFLRAIPSVATSIETAVTLQQFDAMLANATCATPLGEEALSEILLAHQQRCDQ